jgi:tetratricopeptide (TPR) repeat protein
MREAIRRDTNFAQAYAGLANIYGWASGAWMPFREGMPKMREAAMKALALDDSLAEAHRALGWVKLSYDWDLPAAEKEIKRAIALRPDYARAHSCYAWYWMERRLFDKATEEFQLAESYDPVFPGMFVMASLPFFYTRQYGQAIAQCQQALALDPNCAQALWQLSEIYEEKENYADAIVMRGKAALAWAQENPEKVTRESAALQQALSAGGARGYWVKRFELLEADSDPGSSLEERARLYLRIEEIGRALDCLEKAYEMKSGNLGLINCDPRFDALRSEPRFNALLGKLGLDK